MTNYKNLLWIVYKTFLSDSIRGRNFSRPNAVPNVNNAYSDE